MCLSPVLTTFHLQPLWFPWEQNSSGPTIQEEIQSLRQVCHIYSWESEDTRPQRLCFISETDFIQIHREGDGILRTVSDRGTHTFPFLLMLLSCNSQPLTLKWGHRRKGKPRAAHNFSFLQSFLILAKLRETVYVSKSEIMVELVLCVVSTVLLRMRHTYTYNRYEIIVWFCFLNVN